MFRKKLEALGLDKIEIQDNMWNNAYRRFVKNRMAVISVFVLITIVLLSFILPHIIKYSYDFVDVSVAFPSKPSISNMHYFGTDGNGRDLLIRLFMGSQISISIGMLASFVSLIIGVLWGTIAGYLGGKVDLIMMRIVDIMYAIPFMAIIIILVVVFGRNISLIFISIGAISWLTMSRIVRGQTISIKNMDYIKAAKSYALPTHLIIIKHIIPNLLGTVIIYLTLTIPNVILIESFISFLGLGVQEPETSLGVLIADGSKVIEDYFWMFLFPFIFLALILFCFNFIGDGLRDALDPKSK